MRLWGILLTLTSLPVIGLFAVSCGAAAGSRAADSLAIGKFRPAFDHVGALSHQIESVAASGCTVTYAGLGACTYTGLPAKAEMGKLVDEVRAYNAKGHALHVPVMLSYLCATSIVNADTFTRDWGDYAPDLPAGVDAHTLLQQDINGNNLPSWYGAPYNPADMWNPVWRRYQRFLIKLVVQSGHDGVFYDNPTVHPSGNYSEYAMKAWSKFLKRSGVKVADESTAALRQLTKSNSELWLKFRSTEAADFFREMRDYGRSLDPNFILTANDSLNSWDSFYSQPRAMGYSIFEKSKSQDFLTIEDMASSPRRDGANYVSYASTLKMIHAIGHGKPLSVCTIANSDYTTPSNMMKLAIAECTAQNAAYLVWACWDKQYRQAQELSVRGYHDFLDRRSAILAKTEPVSDTVVIWPYENWLERADCPTAYLTRYLSDNNVQYDVVDEADLTAALLSKYRNAVWAAGEPPRKPGTQKLLSHFAGKTFELTVPSKAIDELRKSASVSIVSVPGVRASVRRSAKGCLLHLYNLNVVRQDSYHDSVEQVGDVRVSWLLPKGVAAAGLTLNCLTPDPDGSSGRIPFTAAKVGDRTRISFTVPKLHIWSVIAATPG